MEILIQCYIMFEIIIFIRHSGIQVEENWKATFKIIPFVYNFRYVSMIIPE